MVDIFKIRRCGRGSPSQSVGKQAIDDVVLRKLLAMGMDVVPHQELAEREISEQAFFFHIPSFLLFKRVTYDGEYHPYIDAAIVGRQCVQTVDDDVVVLTQKFHQCDIERNVFVACADIIIALFVDHLYREQQQGSIARNRGLGCFKPPQRPDSEIQRIGTGLFYCIACCTIDMLENAYSFRFGQESVEQMMVLDVIMNKIMKRFEQFRSDKSVVGRRHG